MDMNKNLNMGYVIRNYASNAFRAIKRPALMLATAGIMAYSLTGCNNNDGEHRVVVDNSVHFSSTRVITGDGVSTVNAVINDLDLDSIIDSYHQSGLSVDSFNSLNPNIDLELKGDDVFKLSISSNGISMTQYYGANSNK